MYKGLALANNGSGNFLYATDFHNNKIDVFDTNFAKVTTSGGFTEQAIRGATLKTNGAFSVK